MTCTNLDIFVVCRSVKCQQVIVATVTCVSIIKVGLLTFELALRAAVLSAQPLEERSHHLGAAEAFEAVSDVVVVPACSPDLHHPADVQPAKYFYWTVHLNRWSTRANS